MSHQVALEAPESTQANGALDGLDQASLLLYQPQEIGF
jgi:hypothetical protein